MNNSLRNLTKTYVAKFNDKDIPAILDLIEDDFELTDPANHIIGKEGFKEFLSTFFENDICFSFQEILVDGDTSVIHFTLRVNDILLKGVDILKWRGGKIKLLTAYL
mgnify:CR=1 FL=1